MSNLQATQNEIGKMQKIIIRSIEEGARGISTGLVYPPGSYQRMVEIIELARAIKNYNRAFNIHIRSEYNNLIPAIEEVIQIGKRSEIPIITHFKVMARENWGIAGEAMRLIDDARQEGIDVTMEQYPYTAVSTMLHAIIPPWYHTQGPEKLIETIKKDREKLLRKISIIRWIGKITLRLVDGKISIFHQLKVRLIENWKERVLRISQR